MLLEEPFLLRHRFRSESWMKNPWQVGWPQYVDGKTRLIASFDGISILSLRGFAIEPISTPGFAGIIELDSLTTDVSRSRALNADVTAILNLARNSIASRVIENLEEISKRNPMVNLIGFVATSQKGPGYLASQEAQIGSLEEIWENSSDSVLFSTLIDIVAQAWQVSPSALLQQPGWSHDDSHVFGRFVRK